MPEFGLSCPAVGGFSAEMMTTESTLPAPSRPWPSRLLAFAVVLGGLTCAAQALPVPQADQKDNAAAGDGAPAAPARLLDKPGARSADQGGRAVDMLLEIQQMDPAKAERELPSSSKRAEIAKRLPDSANATARASEAAKAGQKPIAADTDEISAAKGRNGSSIAIQASERDMRSVRGGGGRDFDPDEARERASTDSAGRQALREFYAFVRENREWVLGLGAAFLIGLGYFATQRNKR